MARSRSFLDTTGDVLQVYLHLVGKSQVPVDYHLWACLSLLAAVASDRVGYPKWKKKLLHPNLYTMLVGPSGCGKGVAIDIAEGFLAELHEMDLVTFWRGAITGPALIDQIAHKKEGASKIILVMPELSQQIGIGPQADLLLKTLTDLYTGSVSSIKERTRTSGYHEIEPPCINWLSGTIKEWLVEGVPKSHLFGGSLARVCTIFRDQDYRTRVLDPWVPSDYKLCRDYIAARLEAICYLENGVFEMTKQAKQVERAWFYGRNDPKSDTEAPFWNREHDMVLKLAMLFSLSESTDLVIKDRHMTAAQRLVKSTYADREQLINYASVTRDTEPIQVASDLIKKPGAISRNLLLRKAIRHGFNTRQLDEAISALYQSNTIRVTEQNGKEWLVWRDKRRGPVTREEWRKILRSKALGNGYGPGVKPEPKRKRRSEDDARG